MQFIIELIRKIVILVLLMEVVLHLQSGKQYEPYIKMLVGIMVVYSLISGIFGVFRDVENRGLAPMQEFQWSGNWFTDLEEQAQEQVEEAVDEQTGAAHGGMGEENRVPEIEVQVEVPAIAEVEVAPVACR